MTEAERVGRLALEGHCFNANDVSRCDPSNPMKTLAKPVAHEEEAVAVHEGWYRGVTSGISEGR